MSTGRLGLFFAAMLITVVPAYLSAQAAQPTVNMTVSVPGGQMENVSARESGLATLTLGDGAVIGIRPTILDSKPWSRVTVTFFRMPTTQHTTEEIGSVEARVGGGSVHSNTTPKFTVAVTSVVGADGNKVGTR